jgi:hypothetical protein
MQYGKFSVIILVAILIVNAGTYSQERTYPDLGTIPSVEHLKEWDISVNPSGDELPPGSGTASQGASIYMQECVGCHGQTLEGSPMGKPLVGGQGTLGTLTPKKTIGVYWPYATPIWDFINRSMPPNLYNTPIEPSQKLTADEVYALTAFILYKNGIIGENEVMNSESLPRVQMPNRNGFLPVDPNDALDYRGRGCRAGTCP